MPLLRNVLPQRGSKSGFSIMLLLSYVADWIVIIAAALIGWGFSRLEPNHHAFSLSDPSISYPYKANETVKVSVLFVIALVAPAVIVAATSLLLVPGPTTAKSVPKALIWRRKLWEWNTGWMGLALALAGVFVVTEGMKDLFGKPRPDMLSRCDPDLANIDKYMVGGLGTKLPNAAVLVNFNICRNKADMLTHDGFSSFPSGHSSFSWAGMVYLALFLCSKFSIFIPYLAPRAYDASDTTITSSFPSHSHPLTETPSTKPSAEFGSHHHHPSHPPPPSLRNQSASPPLILLILPTVPIAVAVFVSASRWSDYRHHGFDVIVGSLMGFVAGWGAFRYYHLPVRRGAGWSWGVRGTDRAWWLGVGREGWGAGATILAAEDGTEGVVDVESGAGRDVETGEGVATAAATDEENGMARRRTGDAQAV